MKQELTLENLLYGLRCPDSRIRRTTWEYFCRNYADNPVCKVENIDFSQTDCWGNPVYSLAEMYTEFFLFTNNYREDNHCCHFFKILEQDNSSLSTEHLITLTTRRINPEYKKQILTILQNRTYDSADSLILMLNSLRLDNEEILLSIVINNIKNFELSLIQIEKVCNVLNNTFFRHDKYQRFGLDLVKNLKITQDDHTQLKLVLLWKSLTTGDLNFGDETSEYLELFSQMICEHCLNDVFQLFSHPNSLLNNSYIFIGSKVEIIQNFINHKYKKKNENTIGSQSAYVREISFISNICNWILSQLSHPSYDNRPIYLLPLCVQLEQITSGHLKTSVFNVVSKVLLFQFYKSQYNPHKDITQLNWKDIIVVDNQVQEHTYQYLELQKNLLQNFGAIICEEIDKNEFLQMCKCLYHHSNADISNLSKELLLIYLSNFNILHSCLNSFNNHEQEWQVENLLCDCLDGLNVEHQNFPYSSLLQFLYRMIYDCNDVLLKNKILETAKRLYVAHKDKFNNGEKEIYQTIFALQNKDEENSEVSNYLYLQKVLNY